MCDNAACQFLCYQEPLDDSSEPYSVLQNQVSQQILCSTLDNTICQELFAILLCVLEKNTLANFAVTNVGCVDNLPNVVSFLVIVQNLEFTSSNMQKLCAKYLIRKINYTPCRPLLIISPGLFFLEQQGLCQPEP